MTYLEPDLATNDHHLSLNAMKGTDSMGILRFTSQIGQISVQVLVDGGSSDNFLQPRIAEFIKLPVEPGPCFKVLVGNGQSMIAEGVVPNLSITLQGHELTIPVFLLPVVGADIILGSSWLATLGPHVADYAALTLKFFNKGKFMALQGERGTPPKLAQFNHYRMMRNTDAIADSFTVQLFQFHTEDDALKYLPQHIAPEIALLLHTYSSVFQTPTSLPPPRSQNHAIPLLEGTQPVKVKSYRYPHSQKEQIEKMVHEMLDQGIIQPSTSPFSSPIVPVKKKDDSWRFCTDYRAYVVTIKDSFPMPTVDELLDDLFGAISFFKTGLKIRLPSDFGTT